MDIFLDDRTSLQLTRQVARNQGIALVPADVTQPTPLPVSPRRLDRIGIPQLLSYLRISEENPLGLVVPAAADRVRTRLTTCTVDGHPRGDRPFLQLTHSDVNHPSPLVPQAARVFVRTPTGILLGMARRLRRIELDKGASHHKTTLLLLKLCLELCGTYAHDPFDPHRGEVTYGVTPPMTKQELTDFLAPAGREQGLALARTVCSLAYDMSGSPQESFMGPALFCDTSFGGLALAECRANEPLPMSVPERASIGWRTITPDFLLEEYRSVVEYLGAIHNEGDNPKIDHVRSLDYQTLGWREFGFWYDDVRDQHAFMESAKRIVSVIERYDGSGVRERFLRLRRDKGFRNRQRMLFEVFRPWLR